MIRRACHVHRDVPFIAHLNKDGRNNRSSGEFCFAFQVILQLKCHFSDFRPDANNTVFVDPRFQFADVGISFSYFRTQFCITNHAGKFFNIDTSKFALLPGARSNDCIRKLTLTRTESGNILGKFVRHSTADIG